MPIASLSGSPIPAPRTVTLHAFASVKGGVGKSTLAVVCAKLLARRGRVPVVIDCDLLGTSLADGLRLEAPALVPGNDGLVDLTTANAATSYHSVDKTRELRARRRGDAAALPPPYLHDVLRAVDKTSHPVQVNAALWRHEQPDGVAYLPSSSLQQHIVESLRWYEERLPFDWMQCLAWSINDLVTQRPDVTDVVLDLPTGAWGFAHEAMVLVSGIDRGVAFEEGFPAWHECPLRWRANPFLVTTTDSNDLMPALEYVCRNQRVNVPSLRVLLARGFSYESRAAVYDRARRLLGPTIGALGLEEKLVPVCGLYGFAFKDGDVQLGGSGAEIARALRIEAP